MTAMPRPRLPDPLTPEALRDLMRERPYWDLKHPQSELYHRLVRRGFEMLYPGPAQYDGIGRMIDTPPRSPGEVARLVAQTNRELEAMGRGLDEPSSGSDEVHVQSHTRDDGKTKVSDYWRAAPGQGGGEAPVPGRPSGQPENRTLEYRPGRDDVAPEPLGPARKDDDPGAVNFDDEEDSDDRSEPNARDVRGEADDPLPTPDSREPVDPEDFYRKIGFDPNGEKQWQAVLRRPLDAPRVGELEAKASHIAREEYPGVLPRNNEADAFRHAYWSFEVARQIGPDAAKEFGDAHERSDPNPIPERLMDLYNNKIGRDLAADPRNADRDAREVIREAIREEKLRTNPFRTNEPPSLLPDRAPGFLYPPTSGRER